LNQPLVSICIPTYNRAQQLARALESAINQDYRNLEIIVSDNASTDETAGVVAEHVKQDRRVRHIRKASNVGLTANFNESIRLASGTYRMWLADDDWLDSNFVGSAVSALIADPDSVMVTGQCKIHREGESVEMARRVDITSDSATCRIIRYYATVAENSAFYGLYKAQVVTAIELADDKISADWQFLATVALAGKITTASTTSIHRGGDTGASSNLREYAQQFGLSKILVYEPYLAAAIEAYNDIARENDAYSRYSAFQRKLLAVVIFSLIVFKKIAMRRTYRAFKAMFS